MLFLENHARDCQEIEESRRICCEEADRARQARSDELSLQHERNPTTVSQMMAQIGELQIPDPMQENFSVLNQGAALERPTFPIELLLF